MFSNVFQNPYENVYLKFLVCGCVVFASSSNNLRSCKIRGALSLSLPVNIFDVYGLTWRKYLAITFLSFLNPWNLPKSVHLQTYLNISFNNEWDSEEDFPIWTFRTILMDTNIDLFQINTTNWQTALKLDQLVREMSYDSIIHYFTITIQVILCLFLLWSPNLIRQEGESTKFLPKWVCKQPKFTSVKIRL